jgi:hypothetical protein
VKKSRSRSRSRSRGRGRGRRKGISGLDVLRMLGGLFLLNCLLSYFITTDSVLWGWRPWFIRPAVVMRYLVSNSPSHLHQLTTILTSPTAARPRPPNRVRARRLRRHRPHQTHLPLPRRHHLRRHRRSPHLRSGGQLPRFRRQRRHPRLHHWLLRRGRDPRRSRRRVDVRPHRRSFLRRKRRDARAEELSGAAVEVGEEAGRGHARGVEEDV